MDFNNAIAVAEANNFGVAYSNQAFEYWILLHFDDHQGGVMHRDHYGGKLDIFLKPFSLSYVGSKSKIISNEIFEILEGVDARTKKERTILAIERAKRNLKLSDQTNVS